jgi:hypothetical protein
MQGSRRRTSAKHPSTTKSGCAQPILRVTANRSWKPTPITQSVAQRRSDLAIKLCYAMHAPGGSMLSLPNRSIGSVATRSTSLPSTST